MKLLSKLTLVIFTYNRSSYALRNMSYWSGREPTVHVFDGSEVRISENKLKKLSRNINYHYCPKKIYERLRLSCKFVDTEYCVFLGDDDLFLPSGLNAAISELDNDKDIIACYGQESNFLISSEEKPVGNNAYPELKNYCIQQHNSEKRMIAHMTNYHTSTFYAVVRSSYWKKVVVLMTKYEFPVFAIAELQFELAIAYFGKFKVIDVPFLLRSCENEPIRGTDPSLVVENSFDLWWSNPSKKQERDDFFSLMAEGLSVEVEDDYDDIKLAVEKAMLAYYNSTYNTKTNNKLTIRSVVSSLRPKLSGFARKVFGVNNVMKIRHFLFGKGKKDELGHNWNDLRDVLLQSNEVENEEVIEDIDEIYNMLKIPMK